MLNEFLFLFGLSFSCLKIFWGCNFCLFQWGLKWRDDVPLEGEASCRGWQFTLVIPACRTSCQPSSLTENKKPEWKMIAFRLRKLQRTVWHQENPKFSPAPPKKVMQLCAGCTSVHWDVFFLSTPAFSISGYSLRLTQWDWLHRSKVSFFAPVVAFFPSYRKPQGSGFIVFGVLSSLKITHKANNWFSCCLFPMRTQMSASAQCLLLPTNKCTSRNLYLATNSRCPLCCSPPPRPRRYFGKTLMKCQKEKEMWELEARRSPLCPLKMCEDQTAGQMFGLKLAWCFFFFFFFISS